MKILIIDDEETITSMLADVFEVHGNTVMIANSGPEGLSKVNSFLPDIITLDLNMPGMDGFEVLEQLKKNPLTRNIPVLIASVNDDNNYIKKGILLGAKKYFIKPFSIEDLEKEIERCCA